MTSPRIPKSPALPGNLERVASARSSSRGTVSSTSRSTHAMSSAGTIDFSSPSQRDAENAYAGAEELDNGHDSDHEEMMEDMYAEAEAARARLGQMGTRSMQNMKKEIGVVGGQGRTRSMTDARPPSPKMVIPPVPVIQSSGSGKPPKSTKSGGFSSFLRRLTGKGKKEKKSAPAASVPSRPPPPPVPATRPPALPPTRPPVVRQETAPVVSASPPRRHATRQNSMPSVSSASSLDRALQRPIQPSAVALPLVPQRPGPVPAVAMSNSPALPIKSPFDAEEVDPAEVPLPPSPLTSPAISEIETLKETASAILPNVTSQSSRHMRKSQSPMLSFEGFEIQEEIQVEEETVEEADQIKPLKPLRININRSSSAGSVPAPPKSASSVESTIQTPAIALSMGAAGTGYFADSASGSESSPERPIVRLEPSSPSRKQAAAAHGLGLGLDRKESKWRKSVAGLHDTINHTVTRKQTTRQPPSSHDAYMTQQRRMANNRVSCQPTLHSNATIGAKLTTIKSEQEKEVAETFFLS